MQSRLSRYKEGCNWRISGVNREEMELFYEIISVLWLINLIVLSVCAPLLKSHYPRTLGFRETFIPLHIISAVIVLPLSVMNEIGNEENLQTRLSKLFASIICFLLTGLHLFYFFSIPENMRLINQVKNLENSNDTDVAFLTTYYLAVYTDCCFLTSEEAPPFDCNATDFEAPCYEDEELFESFLDDFSLANSKCFALTKFDPYGENDSYGSPSDGICKRSQKSFFTKIGNKAYRRLWVLSIVCLLYVFFAFWYASEYFYFCLGDMI